MGEGKHFFWKWNTSVLCIYVVHDIFRLQEFYLSLINQDVIIQINDMCKISISTI